MLRWNGEKWSGKKGPKKKGKCDWHVVKGQGFAQFIFVPVLAETHGIFILPLKRTNTFCFNFSCLTRVTSVDSSAGCPQPELQPIPGSDKTDGISGGRTERQEKGYDHTICINMHRYINSMYH